jgi:hypothetical protein
LRRSPKGVGGRRSFTRAAYAAVSDGISFYLRTPELNGAAGATIIVGGMVSALPTLSQFNAIVSSQNMRQ